jgi:hypothetical protein
LIFCLGEDYSDNRLSELMAFENGVTFANSAMLISTFLFNFRPGLRDHLVRPESNLSFDNVFPHYAATLSVNWPYKPQDCLLPVTPEAYETLSRILASLPDPAAPSPAGALQNLIVSHPDHQPQELWRLNPVFETHIRDLANWSVGSTFGDALPSLAEFVNVGRR